MNLGARDESEREGGVGAEPAIPRGDGDDDGCRGGELEREAAESGGAERERGRERRERAGKKRGDEQRVENECRERPAGDFAAWPDEARGDVRGVLVPVPNACMMPLRLPTLLVVPALVVLPVVAVLPEV